MRSNVKDLIVKTFALPLLLAFAGACAAPSEPVAETPAPAPPAPVTFGDTYATPVEQAHGIDAWKGHEAVEANVVVNFGGNTAFDGKMLFTPDTSRVRMDVADGSTAIWDGSTAWVTPADSAFQGARFHLLTWPYFLAAPMKLRDPGTQMEDLGDLTLGETAYAGAKLTFGAGVGDSPDDWYILYRDPSSNVLHGMAYIVTFGSSLEKAEAEPHAITYGGFSEVGGVQIPQSWQFWMWSEEEGITGDPIGNVELTDVRFVTPAADAFAVPEGAREESLPPAPDA